jgi:hypothetical protein
MKPLRPKNTKKEGLMELFIYRDSDKFIGVNLTFDIVEEGDNPALLLKSIEEASVLHLETVVKNNLSDDLLNRYAPEEYWDKYFASLARANKKSESGSYFSKVPYKDLNLVLA